MHLYQLLFSLLIRQIPDKKQFYSDSHFGVIIPHAREVTATGSWGSWRSLHLQSKDKDRWVLGSAHFLLFLYVHALEKASCAAISKTGPAQWRRDLCKSLWGTWEKHTPIFHTFSTLMGIWPRILCATQVLSFHCRLTCIHHTPDPSMESFGESPIKLTTRESSCW